MSDLARTSNVDVMIITKNEELNLVYALNSVRSWVGKVFVIDSGSTDRTIELARESGAILVCHKWLGYAKQKNYGLSTLPFASDWILILDADEAVDAELCCDIKRAVDRPWRAGDPVAYYVNRYLVFLGRRIRHCGYYPSWNIRLIRRGHARYEDRAVHEHMVVDGRVGYLKGHLIHHDRRGLEAYVAKHNLYSTLEAQQEVAAMEGASIRCSLFGDPLERRRWWRERVFRHLPFRWIFRFLFMYIVRLGFLDGIAGFRLCAFIAYHEFLVGLKKVELLQRYSAKDGSL